MSAALRQKAFAYTVRTILVECMVRPVIFKDHNHIEVEPLSGLEKYRLPDPEGENDHTHERGTDLY